MNLITEYRKARARGVPASAALAAARRAIATIESETVAIAELDMAGEF